MSTRQESDSGRSKKKNIKVESRTEKQKVVEVKLSATVEAPAQKKSARKATKGSEQSGGLRSTRISALQRKRAKKAQPVAEEAAPSIAIDQMDTAETHRLIKTFRKVSAQAQKQKEVKAKVSYSNFLAKPPTSGKKYTIDLRVHTPGTVGYFTSGGVEPGPALVRLARVKGLDMIGLTDFYNASYIDIVHDSIGKTDLTILPGFDLCCEVGGCRDVHVTALFPEHFRSADLAVILTELQVPARARGRSDFCLEMGFDRVLEIVESRGGIVIPSQLDKTPYRQLAIPALVEQYGIRVFDLVYPENTQFFKDRWPDGEFVFLSFSNSTALAQIGTRMARIKLQSPSFEGLKNLIQRRD